MSAEEGACATSKDHCPTKRYLKKLENLTTCMCVGCSMRRFSNEHMFCYFHETNAFPESFKKLVEPGMVEVTLCIVCMNKVCLVNNNFLYCASHVKNKAGYY